MATILEDGKVYIHNLDDLEDIENQEIVSWEVENAIELHYFTASC